MRTLDLDKLVLLKGAHAEASNQMCIMEAVAYMAGEPWSDSPQCASTVLSIFLRSYNDAVSDEIRKTLKPFIPRLIGTKASRAVEERRSLAAADWLVRVYMPAWLRLADLTEQARSLESLPEITAMSQLPSIRPAIDSVRKDASAAWAAASRAAGDAASRAASRAAWVAASHAAWEKLRPTVSTLQATVPALIEKMLAITEVTL